MKTLDELLVTEFDSFFDAFNALEKFLQEIDVSTNFQNRGRFQNLYVLGNRIYA
ncbi:MAG: hypothetical protein HFJ60_06755 [Clostridia bacterium]|jgi:hypothetical protein|nr:hypothetical protein [Clostridia bacterium]